MAQRGSPGSKPAGLVVSAHSAGGPHSKFASMVSPLKGGVPVTASSGAHAAANGSATAPPAAAAAPIVVAPPSGSGSMNRFTTMLPMESRQPVPASSAPDDKPDAARVYAGLTNGKAGREDARKKFWTAALGGAPSVPAMSQIDTSSLSSQLREEILMELEDGHFINFDPPLSRKDVASLQRVLECELALSEREQYVPGSSHLCARLLLACERDEQRTLGLLVLLQSKLASYTSEDGLGGGDSSPLRNDVLLLHDLLAAAPNGVGAELLAHLTALGFDLVDLGDVTSAWFSGLFAHSFPAEFALRAVDLVLLLPDGEGAQACVVGLVLGVLLVAAMQLLQCTNSDALFAFLHDLPATLTRAQAGEVFAHAYWGFHARRDQLAQARREKDWARLVAQGPGTVKFKIGGAGAGGAGGIEPMVSPMHASHHSASMILPHTAGGVLAARAPLQAAGSPANAAASAAVSSVPSFNLQSYSVEAAAARRSLAMREGTGSGLTPTSAGGVGAGGFGSNNPGAVKPAGGSGSAASTPKGAATTQAARNAAATETAAATAAAAAATAAAAAAAAADEHLLAELASVTAAGARAAAPGTTQQLLERSLKELKRLEQARATAAAAAAGAAGSSSSGGSDAAATAARALAATVSALPSIGVHAVDRGALSASQSKRVVPSSGIVRFSELLDYQNFPVLTMAGYLAKSRAPSKLFHRRGSTGFFGNLHRRFFVLQGHFLHYFKSHHELKPTRDESVDLRLAVATKVRNHEFAPFCMSLTMREKGSLVYLLFADSEAVRDVWLECFASATQVPVLTK